MPVLDWAKDAGLVAGTIVSVYGEGGPGGASRSTVLYKSFADMGKGNFLRSIVGQDV